MEAKSNQTATNGNEPKRPETTGNNRKLLETIGRADIFMRKLVAPGGIRGGPRRSRFHSLMTPTEGGRRITPTEGGSADSYSYLQKSLILLFFHVMDLRGGDSLAFYAFLLLGAQISLKFVCVWKGSVHDLC